MRLLAECVDLSIVIPVYNSQECLEALAMEIDRVLVDTEWSYEILLVNDCSMDGSWNVIENICRSRSNVIGVDLRRNFGQDNAILTGMRLAHGKYLAVMDDDLQHHPRDLPAMLSKLNEGADIVFADFRSKRQRLWKNLGSWWNGKVAEWVIGKPPHLYLSPYKVLRREVAELICCYHGPDPYVDGLLLQVTSRLAQISVEHHSRYAGRSNYTLAKSMRVWSRLAVSFSVRPLRLVSWFGLGFSALGILLAAVVVAYRIAFPEEFSTVGAGWASLMAAMLVLGGIQMLFLGIIGEYAGRTYLRVNDKPQTAVREVLNGAWTNSAVPNDGLNALPEGVGRSRGYDARRFDASPSHHADS
jgi:glycosyltransferase involved in cell wall biosynthesis